MKDTGFEICQPIRGTTSNVGRANPSPAVRQTGNIQGLLVICGVYRRSVRSGCSYVKDKCRCRVNHLWSIIDDSGFVVSSILPSAVTLLSFHRSTRKLGSRPGKTAQWQGDHEGFRDSTTKFGGMWKIEIHAGSSEAEKSRHIHRTLLGRDESLFPGSAKRRYNTGNAYNYSCAEPATAALGMGHARLRP
jgi:hypothetical protein